MYCPYQLVVFHFLIGIFWVNFPTASACAVSPCLKIFLYCAPALLKANLRHHFMLVLHAGVFTGVSQNCYKLTYNIGDFSVV